MFKNILQVIDYKIMILIRTFSKKHPVTHNLNLNDKHWSASSQPTFITFEKYKFHNEKAQEIYFQAVFTQLITKAEWNYLKYTYLNETNKIARNISFT